MRKKQHWALLKWLPMSPNLNPIEHLQRAGMAPIKPEETGAVCSRRVDQTTSGKVQKPYSELQKALDFSYCLQKLCYKKIWPCHFHSFYYFK